jgi:hypothetical protein
VNIEAMVTLQKHDSTISQLLQLGQRSDIKARVTELFISALATGQRRAITPIVAFYSSKNLCEHEWQPFVYDQKKRYYSPDEVPCAICGLVKEENTDRETIIADLISGRCNLATSYDHLIDLNDIDNIHLEFESAHSKTLHQLLTHIECAPSGEVPSDLEKRIAKSKILPKSNLASRLWTLRILSELGVMHNRIYPGYSGALSSYSFTKRAVWEQEMHDKSPSRSDPVWPLSIWRGGDGVNWKIARMVFPQLSVLD